LRGWAGAFNSSADILIYGCDVAATDSGRQLINTIAALTGTEVGASEDLTGHESLGGDWDLEHQTGRIDASLAFTPAFRANWLALLPNSAPTLDNTKSPVFNAMDEDGGAPAGAVGTLVLSLVDLASPSGQLDNVTDADADALLGIAVTAADTSNGTWWYSTNGGTNWNALGAVADNNARLLAADANTRIYFQPNANYNGTVASAITFRAWDRTTGSNGTLADTSTNGGTTAFSSATDTASITVNAMAEASDVARMATGTFTGNGVDNRAVTGLGFAPDLVIVKSSGGHVAVFRTSAMSGDVSKPVDAAALTANLIQSLDSGGFTVGNDNRVNQNGTTYEWIAFNAAPGFMQVGSYAGNGSSQSISGLGFSPEVMLLASGSTDEANIKTSSMASNATIQLDNEASVATNRITSFDSDGFSVGSSSQANGSGKTFYYVAWNASSNLVSLGSYSGNDNDDRNITGAGFAPEYVLIKGTDGGAGHYAMHKTEASGVSTDSSMYFDNVSSQANRIQELESDGFEIGSNSDVNEGSDTYYWVAFNSITEQYLVDASNDSVSVAEDTPATFDVRTNDIDPEAGTLTVIDFTQPASGTVVKNGDDTLTYTPVANASGSTTLEYMAMDSGSSLSHFWGLSMETRRMVWAAPTARSPGQRPWRENSAPRSVSMKSTTAS
jgi:hypothetical protein